MNTLVEDTFGHGGLPKKWDARDHKVAGLGMASIPFNWTEGFDIEEKLGYHLTPENQGQSSSCGGQAGKNYLQALKALVKGSFERLSAKDMYCHIFYPGGGTTIRDIGNYAVQVGVKTEKIVSSYENGNTPSEWFMEDKSMSNASPLAEKFKEFGYAFPKRDIDSIAQAARDNNGAVLLVHGKNNDTWLSTFPLPPQTKIGGWNHFVFVGKAKLINGKKFIGILNSWGDVGDRGWQWLGEEYFTSMVTDAIVFYDKTLFTYTPTTGQVTLTWLQTFLKWFRLYY